MAKERPMKEDCYRNNKGVESLIENLLIDRIDFKSFELPEDKLITSINWDFYLKTVDWYFDFTWKLRSRDSICSLAISIFNEYMKIVGIDGVSGTLKERPKDIKSKFIASVCLVLASKYEEDEMEKSIDYEMLADFYKFDEYPTEAKDLIKIEYDILEKLDYNIGKYSHTFGPFIDILSEPDEFKNMCYFIGNLSLLSLNLKKYKPGYIIHSCHPILIGSLNNKNHIDIKSEIAELLKQDKIFNIAKSKPFWKVLEYMFLT